MTFEQLTHLRSTLCAQLCFGLPPNAQIADALDSLDEDVAAWLRVRDAPDEAHRVVMLLAALTVAIAWMGSRHEPAPAGRAPGGDRQGVRQARVPTAHPPQRSLLLRQRHSVQRVPRRRPAAGARDLSLRALDSLDGEDVPLPRAQFDREAASEIVARGDDTGAGDGVGEAEGASGDVVPWRADVPAGASRRRG